MDSIISIIKRRVASHPERIALRYRKEGRFLSVTWGEMDRTVSLVACALLEMGVKIGDKVAILSENRPEWVYADLAILSCGAVTVPIYATDSESEIEFILKDSGARIVFASDQEKLKKILAASESAALKRLISFQGSPNADPLVTVFENLLAGGEKAMGRYRDALNARVGSITPENVATIIYSSGSTGCRKGVILTHSNFVSNCRSSAKVIRVDKNDRYMSILPLSHVFERMGGYYMMLIQGAQIAYAKGRDTIVEDARSVLPTLIFGVPRFFEKIYSAIMDKAARSGPVARNIFFWGYRIGRACAHRRSRKKRVPLYLAAQELLVTRPIGRKIRKMFGGRLRFFISGGAPLSKEIAYFFLSFGILVLEGYGLTESSPVIAVNTEKDHKVGTVGRPVPDVDVRIAPDGEILAKGPNVMKGYHNTCADSESALIDGWLHTGDIGLLDEDGFLAITDRKKEIIVTSCGKNIPPQNIETMLKADKFIEDILVYGDKRKYLTALVIPDFESLKRYASYKGIIYKDPGELADEPAIRDFLKRRIDAKQRALPEYSQIKRFAILRERLDQAKGELTPTLKIKRRIVTAKHKDLLDSLYEDDR
jgi:long-chain acyl-CoA synthetase